MTSSMDSPVRNTATTTSSPAVGCPGPGEATADSTGAGRLESAHHPPESVVQGRHRVTLAAAFQPLAQHLVVRGDHGTGDHIGPQRRIRLVGRGGFDREPSGQETTEHPEVLVHAGRLAGPQGGNGSGQLVAPQRYHRVIDIAAEDHSGPAAQGTDRREVGGRRQLCLDRSEHALMVGQDRIVLGPEVPEERPPGHPRPLRDRIHGRVLVTVRGKELVGRGGDACPRSQGP